MADQTNPLGALDRSEGVSNGHETAHEFVRETLRQAILSGRLPGGTRLVQAELAEHLQVSTTPVREALRDLASEGLIKLDAHRGGEVHQISQDELREIYDLRSIVEIEALRRAAEAMTPERIEQARRLHEEMLSAPESAHWVMLNRDFHLTLYQAANLPRLLTIVRSLLDSSVMYVSAAVQQIPDARERAGADHAELLDKLAAGDAAGAVEVIERHMAIPASLLDDDR